MPELWNNIPGYEELYRVSTSGRIRSVRTGDIMKQFPHYKGHLFIFLYKPGVKRKKMFVHRAVAMAFMTGFDDSEVVNHRDSNKVNNDVTNLEWTSSHDNTIHYWNGVTTMEERNNAF